jgi:hypothetical protein
MTFFPFCQSKGLKLTVNGKINFLFSIFALTQITKTHFYPPKMGAKMGKKNSLAVDRPFD